MIDADTLRNYTARDFEGLIADITTDIARIGTMHNETQRAIEIGVAMNLAYAIEQAAKFLADGRRGDDFISYVYSEGIFAYIAGMNESLYGDTEWYGDKSMLDANNVYRTFLFLPPLKMGE